LIRILVRDAVEQEFDSGGADRMMKRNYAASRAGIRRE